MIFEAPLSSSLKATALGDLRTTLLPVIYLNGVVTPSQPHHHCRTSTIFTPQQSLPSPTQHHAVLLTSPPPQLHPPHTTSSSSSLHTISRTTLQPISLVHWFFPSPMVGVRVYLSTH
ncbi:hypothetical protein Tco_0257346, partial [Tanacetum coccineum]